MMRVKGEQNVAAVRGLGSNSTQRYIEVHKRQLLEEIVAAAWPAKGRKCMHFEKLRGY